MATKITFSTKLKSILWLLLPVLAGIVVFVAAPLIKTGPQKSETPEQAVKVRTITVSKLDVIPRVIGYGKVVPVRTWDAVAEVAGQVNWIADELRDGRDVTAGKELLRIEDSNYRLALAQTVAQLRASEAKVKITRDGLTFARKELELLRADYERKKELAEKGTVSKVVIEAAERLMIAGQTQVANLQNTIDLNAAEHQVLIAQRDAAKLDLARTHMIAPFDARITTVQIGVGQYTNKGQLMFSADGLDVAEVAAQFPVGILRPLIIASGKEGANEVRRGALALQAVIRLRTATHIVEWPARISRVTGTIDPQTQSLGVVAAVDRPTEIAKPGERPPLFRNTFVEVELFSSPIKDQIVVPLNAIHQGMVYMVDAGMRLEKRKVTVMFSQKGYAVLKSGVKPGERIVTSDLITAVDGMLLAPQEDNKTTRRMIMEATGRERAK
jgi:RND family efflux transporter MFP subunit